MQLAGGWHVGQRGGAGMTRDTGPATSDIIRVLVADDHPVVREGLRGMLAGAAGIQIAGEAASGTEAVAMAALCQPDVILMDLRMPGGGGVAAIARLAIERPEIRVAGPDHLRHRR
jgi:CheY-like chemotaxis protein